MISELINCRCGRMISANRASGGNGARASQGQEESADTNPGSSQPAASCVTLDRHPPPRSPVGNCEIREGAPSVACKYPPQDELILVIKL